VGRHRRTVCRGGICVGGEVLGQVIKLELAMQDETGKNNNKLLPSQLGKIAATRSKRVPDVRPIHPISCGCATMYIYTSTGSPYHLS